MELEEGTWRTAAAAVAEGFDLEELMGWLLFEFEIEEEEGTRSLPFVRELDVDFSFASDPAFFFLNIPLSLLRMVAGVVSWHYAHDTALREKV